MMTQTNPNFSLLMLVKPPQLTGCSNLDLSYRIFINFSVQTEHKLFKTIGNINFQPLKAKCNAWKILPVHLTAKQNLWYLSKHVFVS